jgi:hypothetical protein
LWSEKFGAKIYEIMRFRGERDGPYSAKMKNYWRKSVFGGQLKLPNILQPINPEISYIRRVIHPPNPSYNVAARGMALLSGFVLMQHCGVRAGDVNIKKNARARSLIVAGAHAFRGGSAPPNPYMRPQARRQGLINWCPAWTVGRV